MNELFFVVKSLAITLVLVLVMQIKWGGNTLEESSHQLLQESSITAQLQKVSNGGVMAIKNGWQFLQNKISYKKSDESEKIKEIKSRLNLQVKRSEDYLRSHQEPNLTK